MLPHLVWESILLLTLAVVLVAAVSTQNDMFVWPIWRELAPMVLVVSAFALALRTGWPNLAVPGFAAAASIGFVKLVNSGVPSVTAIAVVFLGCLAGGLVLGAVAALTPVPAWALSLAALAVLTEVAIDAAGPEFERIADQSIVDGAGRAWLGITVVVLSILGGFAFAAPGVQRALRLNRDLRTPATPGTHRIPAALVGLGGSAAMGAMAGVIGAGTSGYPFAIPIPSSAILLMLALLGGVSLFGGRGGIAGTVLATLLYIVTVEWVRVSTDPGGIPSFGLLVAALTVLGIVASFGLDYIGRRRDAPLSGLPTPNTPPPVPTSDQDAQP